MDGHFEHFWFSYWWLIFPIGWMLFGAWDRWLMYRRSKDALDLIRTYSAEGKEPPPELLRRAREDFDPDVEDYGDRYARRRARRAYRRYYRWGPLGAIRSALFMGAMAAAFWYAAEMHYVPSADGPFRFVAVILAALAVVNLLTGMLFSTLRRPDGD